MGDPVVYIFDNFTVTTVCDIGYFKFITFEVSKKYLVFNIDSTLQWHHKTPNGASREALVLKLRTSEIITT